MPAITFPTRSAAEHYRKVSHSAEFAKRLQTVASHQYVETSPNSGEFIRKPCFVVVLK